MNSSNEVKLTEGRDEVREYEQENLLRTLLNSTPDFIYFKDLNSKFVAYSGSFQRYLRDGEDIHSLKGRSDFDLFTDEHAHAAFTDEQKIINSGQPIIGKLEKEVHQDGRTTWALTSKMPWLDNSGKIIGTLGISKDVTALKNTESKLEETHKRLAHTSRMAGMAEVATDILHNVGNVLNSVNVSCSLVIDRVGRSNFDNISKVSGLIRSKAGHLEEFFASGQQGCQLLSYLEALGTSFFEEKTFLLQELTQLRDHIDHIKRVVSMQQNYAKVAGVSELVTAESLMEDAIQINLGAINRHGIELRREFSEVPPLMVDKHRALQILVNLVSNSKYAVAESEDKTVILRIVAAPLDTITFQVIDHGMGIPKENLERIFAHGYTTRPDGHGFGLHSGALAAMEMGGSLVAHSDGPGKGACFTLKLPLQPPSRNGS